MFDRVLTGTATSGAKTKLLDLFEKVKAATEAAKGDGREIKSSIKLSERGKADELSEMRIQFAEAMEAFRDDMLSIVNKREEDYRGFYKITVKKRMSSGDYLGALMANMDMLRKGYLDRVEVEALLELYGEDDLAMNMIQDVMMEIKSPFIDLTFKRVTVRSQLNAFENIRGIIRSKIHVGLLDKPTPNFSGIDNTLVWFGSGFEAIMKELNEDLTLMEAGTSLGNKMTADKRNQIHGGGKASDMVADANKKRNQRKDQVKPKAPVQAGNNFHAASLPLTRP